MPSSPILPWQETHNPEYRTAKGWRIMMGILAVPLTLLFLALPFLMAPKVSSIALIAGIVAVSLGMAGVMIYALLETVKGVFIIGPREISQVGAFKTKTLALNEISGFRVDDKYANIYPKESYLPTIKVADTVERYQEVIHWLVSNYPDLNRVDIEKATAAILADDTIGETQETRTAALAKAQQVARVLNIAGGVVGAWLFFYPTPYEWAIAAGLLVPALAMIALWRLPYTLRIDEKKNSGYPSVLIAIIAPSMGLLIRTLFDYELVSYAPLWPVVGAAAGSTAVLLALVSRRFLFRQGETASVGFTIVLLALLYGYGATLATNVVYDKGATTFFATKVLGMHISSGKTTTYHLKLQAWGPVPTAEDVQVSSTYYRQVQPGQPVTVALRPGLLGVPWFTVIE